MKDPLTTLTALRRPQLLVDSATTALARYRREPMLRRLLGVATVPGPGQASVRLLEREAEVEEARARRDAAYAPGLHVTLLTALMAEANLLRERQIEGYSNVAAISDFRSAT